MDIEAHKSSLLMTGSFACGSALCSAPTRSVTHELRIGAGRSILTNSGRMAAAWALRR
jgi:hypothetical protein